MKEEYDFSNAERCLEFDGGRVDIGPKTLYRFAIAVHNKCSSRLTYV